MTTQVIFTIDKDLKRKAMRKARSFGLPFSSVLNLATRAFVEGKVNVELVETRAFNAKTRRILTRALKDVKMGRNIVGPFDSAEAMMKSLTN